MEKYGLPSQLRACREAAVSREYFALEEITDDGISGSTLERPGLDRVRQLVREKAVDVVLMLDVDRLSRELAHLLLLKPEIEKHARLEFINATFENSPSGRLFFGVRGVIAQYEREVIRDRTMRGKRERAKAGLVVGGRTCYGYQCVDGKLVADPERAPIAQGIFAWFDAGLSMRAIAQQLRATGAPTWSGRKWGHSSVQRILGNQTYAGLAHYFTHRREGKLLRMRSPGDRIPIPVTPLIDAALWRRVQARLAENRTKGNRPGGPRSTQYLLRGLIYCSCGRRMSGEKRRNYLSYRCHGRDSLLFNGGPCKCAVNSRQLDAAVWRAILDTFTDSERLRKALAEHEARLKNRQSPDLPKLEDQARKLKRREETALSMLFDPDMEQDRAEIKRRYQDAQRERERVEAAIAAARRAVGTVADGNWMDRTVGLLREYIPSLEGEQRQEFVRRLVHRAEWTGGALAMRCFVGSRLATTCSHSDQSSNDLSESLEILLHVRLAA